MSDFERLYCDHVEIENKVAFEKRYDVLPVVEEIVAIALVEEIKSPIHNLETSIDEKSPRKAAKRKTKKPPSQLHQSTVA